MQSRCQYPSTSYGLAYLRDHCDPGCDECQDPHTSCGEAGGSATGVCPRGPRGILIAVVKAMGFSIWLKMISKKMDTNMVKWVFQYGFNEWLWFDTEK